VNALFDEEIKLPTLAQYDHVTMKPSERVDWEKFLCKELPMLLKLRRSASIDVEQVRIQLMNPAELVNLPIRYHTPAQEAYMEEWTKELLSLGFIEPAPNSRWNSPVLVVTSESGKMRLTTDLREVNKKVALTRFPLPNLNNIAAKVRNCHFFFALDASKGYWQVEMAEECRDYFTFSTHWNKFRPLRLPQGFKNSVAIFQQIMTDVLKNLIPQRLGNSVG
jgi:hypothetical protein